MSINKIQPTLKILILYEISCVQFKERCPEL